MLKVCKTHLTYWYTWLWLGKKALKTWYLSLLRRWLCMWGCWAPEKLFKSPAIWRTTNPPICVKTHLRWWMNWRWPFVWAFDHQPIRQNSYQENTFRKQRSMNLEKWYWRKNDWRIKKGKSENCRKRKFREWDGKARDIWNAWWENLDRKNVESHPKLAKVLNWLNNM